MLAAIATLAGLLLVLSLTGPTAEREVSGSLRREGGVCLSLERWGLMGWSEIGQTHTISDVQNAVWNPPTEDPPCSPVPTQNYLVRLPFSGPDGTYRICPLADDNPCVIVERVPYDPGPPGP